MLRAHGQLPLPRVTWMHMGTELPGKGTREQGVSTKELHLALELWENFKSIFSGGLPLPIPLRIQPVILTKTYLFVQVNSLSTYSRTLAMHLWLGTVLLAHCVDRVKGQRSYLAFKRRCCLSQFRG